MKKGATHVDWAISMGIFLVYVLLMFIFLKPATEPLYSGDTLLNTVSSGLKNDTTYTVQRGYFVIRPTASISPDVDYQIRIKGASKYLGKGWRESEEQALKHLTMFNESLGKIPSNYLKDVAFDFLNEYCTGHACSDPDKDVLDMITRLKNNEDNVFWFVYSEDETYNHPTADITYDDTTCQKQNDCLLNDGDDPLSKADNLTYEFGMIETYSGLSYSKLYELKRSIPPPNYPDITGDPSGAGYKKLKDAWHFPGDKDFQINITEV